MPESRKETPDRLAACAVAKTVKRRLPLTGAQQDHRGDEQHHMDRTTRTTGTTGGEGENHPHEQPRFTEARRGTIPWGGGGWGGGSNPGSYMLVAPGGAWIKMV